MTLISQVSPGLLQEEELGGYAFNDDLECVCLNVRISQPEQTLEDDPDPQGIYSCFVEAIEIYLSRLSFRRPVAQRARIEPQLGGHIIP